MNANEISAPFNNNYLPESKKYEITENTFSILEEGISKGNYPLFWRDYISYNDPLTLFNTHPVEIQYDHNDSIEGTYFDDVGEYRYTFSGIAKIHYDAVGKLILPSEIVIENTGRVSVTKTIVRSFADGTNDTITNISFFWFVEGNNNFPVLKQEDNQLIFLQKEPLLTLLSTQTSEQFSVFPTRPEREVTIHFTLKKNASVRIVANDMAGKSTELLPEQKLNSGYYSYVFDKLELGSGVYQIELSIDGNIQTEKIVLE